MAILDNINNPQDLPNVPAAAAVQPTVPPTAQPAVPQYNPNLPVYAAPAVNFQGVELADDPRMTVAGQMGILGRRDSDYMKMMAAKGTQEGMKRGLLNTTMTAESGIKAGNEALLQVATPDAKLYGDAATNNQVAQLELNKMAEQGKITGALAEQDYAGKMELQKASDAAQLERVNIDNEWKRTINYDNLSADRQKSLMNVQAGLGDALTGGIERIMRDTNISNKAAAISALMTAYKSQLITAAAIVGIKLTWG